MLHTILDIHTHHPAPQPQAVVSCSPADFAPVDEQLYSVGIHPWDAAQATEADFKRLAELASRRDVVAIGEAGIDLARDVPLFRQLLLFRRQFEISEAAGKPMIVHCVKGMDILAGLHRDLHPRQQWCIHGFRGKAATAQMLLRAGCYFSLGPGFRCDTARAIPAERLLAETDAAPEARIEDIIAALAQARGDTDISRLIAANSASFLKLQ